MTKEAEEYIKELEAKELEARHAAKTYSNHNTYASAMMYKYVASTIKQCIELAKKMLK